MVDILETILAIFGELGKVLSSRTARDRAKQTGMADILDRIADTLSSAADKLESGIEPIEECSELREYSLNLAELLRGLVGYWRFRKMRRLLNSLDSAFDAPAIGVVKLLVGQDNFSEIRSLREASGHVRAASQLIRLESS